MICDRSWLPFQHVARDDGQNRVPYRRPAGPDALADLWDVVLVLVVLLKHGFGVDERAFDGLSEAFGVVVHSGSPFSANIHDWPAAIRHVMPFGVVISIVHVPVSSET